jgi:iron(II)-dependent oxidoreductase
MPDVKLTWIFPDGDLPPAGGFMMRIGPTCLRTAVALALLTAAGACWAQQAWEVPGQRAGEEIVGPDGGRMVWVPPGEFVMGRGAEDVILRSRSSSGSLARDLAHPVRITRGFWLGKWPVTNVQYWQYCQATRRVFPSRSNQGYYHPVVEVSWYEALAYCQAYRLALPTEAEWEYAARGPERRIYPWGNEWDPTRCGNSANRPATRTFPVGSFPLGASWCGALEMMGNVQEWCQDWFSETYYSVSEVDDPQGAAVGDTIKMFIGDKLVNESSPCRAVRGCEARGFGLEWCGWRSKGIPEGRTDCTGFRYVARPQTD